MMSRSRQRPPGQGFGKLVWAPYSINPFLPPESSVAGTSTGVAILADATSVSSPKMFFHHAVFLVPPGQYASYEYAWITPDLRASSSLQAIWVPITFTPRHTSGLMLLATGSA